MPDQLPYMVLPFSLLILPFIYAFQQIHVIRKDFHLDIRVLQYFLTVAREESITKAAEALRMTQPPLSRQLKDLEAELGKQLLIRGSKKVTLMEDGMLLRKRAEELVDLMEKTKAELTSSSENISGDIYIGCGETESISFLAQAAQNLQKKYPLIHYHIYSGDAELYVVWKKYQVLSRASSLFLQQLKKWD